MSNFDEKPALGAEAFATPQGQLHSLPQGDGAAAASQPLAASSSSQLPAQLPHAQLYNESPPLDAAARKDLSQAEHELAGKLQIVPDGAPGPRLPNQVSRAEFEKLAATYSSIRMGKSDLQFNTDGLGAVEAAEYRSKAMGDMAAMMQTASGRALIGKLADNTDNKDLDAHGNPVHHTTTLFSTKHPDYPDHHDEDEPSTTGLAAKKADKSNGVGTNAMLFYQAGHWINDDYAAAGEKDFEKEGRSDLILYHEMVHALHRTEGTMAKGTAGDAGIAVNAGDAKASLEDYRTVGLGGATTSIGGITTTENEYRKERMALAAGGGKGLLPGDATLHLRKEYMSAAYET